MNITYYTIYYIDKYNIFIFTTTEIRKWILKIWTKHYFITKLQGKAADIKSMNPINMVLMIVNESHKISVLEVW